MPGGELFQHLKKCRVFEEEKARLYCSQIALALQHLHNYGIIYRDLKPENILMDTEGYLKLADFGMSKKLKENEKAMSFCGTPEYLSPEVLHGTGHDHSADWWSFGIILYEMLCSIPPFYSREVDKMFEFIKTSELKFKPQYKVSADAQDIITKLLQRDPSKRLGSKGGLNEIKSHPFFEKVNFELVLAKKEKAPFIPVLQNKFDVGNFDEEFTSEIPDLDRRESFVPNLDLIKKNQDKFKEFK
eukprot:CAMPEP_0170515198 /NCGR_PEP_ID=MMETSP0209-20121228/1660_1 /TAXON_ID=665100 ORGANISM="Litonotus pictus, Strain P1" /NCGR_SAMPLE_ID=MMETSP0209 /ASSEMBLY_ACC=CAM_ASM_000301 /LENGTH=243 /DNA_ID=CAMNT_0010799579 /DNA_START=772 /DNA_END=1503 /DNA_ORIENTATION=+